MGSQLRPGATGLNRRMLELEAPIRKMLMDLFSGEPSGYNDDHPTMPNAGPEMPAPNLLAGATSIGAPPDFQPDSGYGAPSRGAFGLDSFAPLIAAALTGRTPDESAPVSNPSSNSMLSSLFSGGEPSAPLEPRGLNKLFLEREGKLNQPLPEVHNPETAAFTGGLSPEVLALSENLANTSRPMANSQNTSRMPLGPPNSPLGRRAASPALRANTNPVASPINEPRVIEPFDLPDELPTGPDFSALLNSPANRENDLYGGPREHSDNDYYDSPATDEYLDALRHRPTHDEHEGSRARRILSGVFKGLLGADFGIGDAPHQKALRSWSDRNSGLAEAAKYEQSGLKEKRLRMSDVMRQQKNERDYRLKVQQEVNDYKQFTAKLDFMKNKDEKDRLIAERKAQTLERLAQWKHEFQQGTLADRSIGRGLENRRVNEYERRGRTVGDRPLDPKVQEGIEKEARRIVRNDPRFSDWYRAESDDFGSIPERHYDSAGRSTVKRDKQGNIIWKKEIDEPTKQMLAEALVKAKDEVAHRKRSSYSRSGFNSPFTDNDYDEDELDFGSLFDAH